MKSHSIITILMVIVLAGSFAEAKYSGGAGEPNNPYKISSVADWQKLMASPADWAGHFILTSDIDFDGVSIIPIAFDISTSSGFQGTQFTGVFDGNNCVIRNADVYMPDGDYDDYVGLFGYLGTNGQIKNLGVENTLVFGQNYVGGLVGYNEYGSISNCYSTGFVNGTSWDVGGLVGYNYYGIISNCYSTGPVNGKNCVGGLVGSNYYGTISNCYSTGSVSGMTNVGGLVGKADFRRDYYADLGNLSDEINHNLRGWDQVGSWGMSSSGDTTARCQRIGVDNILEFCVEQTDIPYILSAEIVDGTCEDNFEIYVNGIGPIYSYISNKNDGITIKTHQVIIPSGYIPYSRVQVNFKNTSNDLGCGDAAMYYGRAPVSNVKLTPLSYSTGSVSGTTGVDILVGYGYYYATTSSSFWDVNTSGWATSAGGTPKTTAEMKTRSTFTDAGWDFIEIWGIGEHQTYPYLRFAPAGDLNIDSKVDLIDLAILAEHWLEATNPQQ